MTHPDQPHQVAAPAPDLVDAIGLRQLYLTHQYVNITQLGHRHLIFNPPALVEHVRHLDVDGQPATPSTPLDDTQVHLTVWLADQMIELTLNPDVTVGVMVEGHRVHGCYLCPSTDPADSNNPDPNLSPLRGVVGTKVVDQRDPTQAYHLTCGHWVI